MNGREDLDDLGPGERDAALAGEYVLRLLDAAEERACAAREAAEPAFAAEAARWRADLGALDDAYAPVAPPAAARARVLERVFPEAPRASALGRLWANVGLWRGAAALATVAALWLALAPPESGPRTPGAGLVAALAPATAGGTELLAVFDPAASELRLNRVAGAAAPGRALELWLIPAGSATPVSLGVLPEAAVARVVVPEALVGEVGAGALLAVSDEPAGGSPTGAPSAAPLAAGALRDI